MAEFVTHIDKSITEEELLGQIDFERLPKHISIIMDGNRRWAKEKGLPGFMGHNQGGETFREIMIACCQMGIEVLTVYAFSSENWSRSPKEIQVIMDLFVKYCRNERELMKDIGVKFRVIGSRKGIAPKVNKQFDEVMEYTKDCTKMILNVCVNYGSRFEILEAAKKLAQDINSGAVKEEEIDEKMFSDYLYTAGQPDPDLMIRTSGELRISNFLLWQNAYSEFWFTDLYWPDFKRRELYTAIVDYQKRDRRFGGGVVQVKNPS